jgi:uncharacterized protein with GYD domain
MSTFFMFGKYSADALKGISAKRTEKAKELIERSGGKILSMYALLGKIDLILIVNLPGIEEALKVSVALTKSTGIAFYTSAAMEVSQFDKIVEGM